MRAANGAEYATREIVAAWTLAGLAAGAAIGGTYGTAIFPGGGTFVGAFIGAIPGVVVGFLDGLLLAWIRPAPTDVPLAAQAATELVLLPLQIWLWFVIHSVAFLPLVVAPSVVSIAVAALLGRRLPPGPGRRESRGPGRSRGPRRERDRAIAARWWSIEVRHGGVSAFRWQEQHDAALTEAALASGTRDGIWHADRRGVVFQVLFDTEEQWDAFLGQPVVRAALAAVPDPVSGLLIYRGGGAGGAGARPAAQAGAGQAGVP
jgi:hypothetical protein